MATGPLASKGTFLKMRSKGSTLAYVQVSSVLTLAGPGGSASEIRVKDLGTTENFDSFLAGFVDPGSVTGSMSYNPSDTGHGPTSTTPNIPGYYADGTSGDWQVGLGGSTAKILAFTGAVTEFNTNFDVDSQVIADFTIRLSAAPTLPSST